MSTALVAPRFGRRQEVVDLHPAAAAAPAADPAPPPVASAGAPPPDAIADLRTL